MRLRTLLLAACAGAAAVIAGCGAAEPEPRPNIILISVDTLRADHLGAYGYERNTSPRIDELARGGVTFLNGYAHSSYTPPSQTSLLTSVHPSVHGVWRHNMSAAEDVPMLAEILQQAGYATGALTELSATHYTRGFETYEPLTALRGPRAARRNAARIREWLADRDDRPFFLFLHLFAVHLPYAPRAEYLEQFADPDYDGYFGDVVELADLRPVTSGETEIDVSDWQHLAAMYDAEIAEMDQFLGDLIDEMKADGTFDSTVFALVSDHGEEFGEHGTQGHSGPLWELILRTPLMFWGPGVPEDLRIDARARNIDVAPTILRLADVTIPDHYEGADLATLWDGSESGERVAVAEKRCCRAIVAGNWKYTVVHETGFEELFELSIDPGELVNLAGSRPEELERMRALAAEWDQRLAENRAQVEQGIEVTLPPEEIKRLRALGYLQ